MENLPVEQKNRDTQIGLDKKIEDLYNLIEGIRYCMMTTRCPKTGRLVSRCMSPRHPNQHTPADLWFFANNASHKFEELEADPNVNLSFLKESTAEWISVSGKARVVNDRQKIKELYSPTIKAWFGDLKDGVRDGGPDDPRVSLIFVEAETVHYSKKDTATPVQIWNIAKGIFTGEPPKVSAERNLDTQELKHAREVNQLDNAVVG